MHTTGIYSCEMAVEYRIHNNGWQSEGAVQIVAGSAQARNDFITYVAEDIDYSHVPPRQNHATSHILPGAYFLFNCHSQTTENILLSLLSTLRYHEL